jgi:hypothetical protein
MSDDNTQGGAEPSLASAGSHGDACRAAFERWADGDGCLRTIKKKNGSYLDGPTRWAWEGWRAATLTDAEREAIDAGADALESLSRNDINGRIRAALMIAANTLRGLLERLK